MSELPASYIPTVRRKVDFEPRPRLFWARLYEEVSKHPELQSGSAYESLCARVDSLPDEIYEQDLELKQRLEAIAAHRELTESKR